MKAQRALNRFNEKYKKGEEWMKYCDPGFISRMGISPEKRLEYLRRECEKVGIPIVRSLTVNDISEMHSRSPERFSEFESARDYISEISGKKPPPYLDDINNRRVLCRWLRGIKIDKSARELCHDLSVINAPESPSFAADNVNMPSPEGEFENEMGDFEMELISSITNVINAYVEEEYGMKGFDYSILINASNSQLRSIISHIYSQPSYVEYISRMRDTGIPIEGGVEMMTLAEEQGGFGARLFYLEEMNHLLKDAGISAAVVIGVISRVMA